MTEYRTVTLEEFGLKITPQASEIIRKLHGMRMLGLPQVWIFEGDDGPEHYQTCESLLDYIADFGGKLIRVGSYDIEMIHKQSVSSGRFLIQLD